MNTTSDHRKLEQEIQKIEKELVEINQLEKDTLKAWQKILNSFKKLEQWRTVYLTLRKRKMVALFRTKTDLH